MYKFISLIALAISLTACTYSINMIGTQGKAKDVVDSTATPTVDVDATANVPISAVPK